MAPISAYERPSSSRMTSAERWLKLRCASAVRISSAVGTVSSTSGAAARSSHSTSFGRREEARKRCRHSLWAILSSQFRGFRGSSPRLKAR